MANWSVTGAVSILFVSKFSRLDRDTLVESTKLIDSSNEL